MDVEILVADDSGCVTLEFSYAGGIATTMVCEAIVFEGDRAYWKADEGMVPPARDFTYMVDESESLIDICSSLGCLYMEYQDGEIRWTLPAVTTTTTAEAENCQQRWIFRK